MPKGAPSHSLGAPLERDVAASEEVAGTRRRRRATVRAGGASYWLETLGCPKNQVDSDKLSGLLESDGYRRAGRPEEADLLVVNTCAFIEAAREESIETVLELASTRKPGARLTVTGCLAERYGQELAEAMPEVDKVSGFGVPVDVGAPVRVTATRRSAARALGARGLGGLALGGLAGIDGRSATAVPLPSFDLLNLPRPPARAPWAYVKVAEGCDRHCGFCAIPSFRGPQRSRAAHDILAEVEVLGVEEVVLVAQDLVSWDRDLSRPSRGDSREANPDELDAREVTGLVQLVRAVGERVERVRLLYLYPSGLSDELVDTIGESGCPYFDLSLQHVSPPLLRRMRRFGNAERFGQKISTIRRRFPEAALRSSFIVGYPGETEEDHDSLLRFLEEAQLDWVGFFAFSPEEGTYAADLPGQIPAGLVAERLRECSELQDAITSAKRAGLVGTTVKALVDAPGRARSHREAPEIDGVVRVPRHLPVGSWSQLEIVDADGPDLLGSPLEDDGRPGPRAGRGNDGRRRPELGPPAPPSTACSLSAGV
jgi:ribosomal protein S12 methylthiotransferase